MTDESLNKTWFVDIDGTIVEHMGDNDVFKIIKEYGDQSHRYEKPIKKSVDFINQIPKEDTVVLTTAREENIRDHTIRMLKHFSIRYDRIMFSLRSGPRYVINDIKPVGVVGNSEPLKMAFAINVERDTGITKEDLCL